MRTHPPVLLAVAAVAMVACQADGDADGTPASTAATTTVSTATSSVATTSTTLLDAAEQAWVDDLQVLAEGVRRLHPDPFWRQDEAEFDAALAAAPERLAQLSDADARAEVMRLMAGIDGHTGVRLGDAGFHLYGLHLYDFDGQFAVITADDPTLVGATVVRIDGMPVADAAAAVAPYSPFDNEWTARLVVPTLLVTPEVLHAAGVIDDVDAPQYELRLADGTTRTVDPAPRTWADAVAADPRPIGMTTVATIPSLARLNEPFWSTELDSGPDGGRTLYVQYNEVVRTSGSTSIGQLADRIGAALDSGGVTRLVVDLRYNIGGNDRTYPPLLEVLTTHPALARPGALVVLIGRQTFSAGTLFATELDHLTGAVFVGEPTGGSPNLYANPRELTLPNSGIVVYVSSKYFDAGGPDDRRDAIPPDVMVASSLADFLAGRDPVLEAALALTAG